MDRAEARRRRRRKGHIRLAVAVAVLVAVIVAVVLLVRACGGTAEESAAEATPTAGTAATADATATPKPVSTKPPLVGLGDTVRFETPDGDVVRVTAEGYADPGDPPAGVTPDAGERLVTLELTVRPEGAGGEAVALPFAKADSFILVAADDTLAVARLADDVLLGAAVPPGETVTATLAFSVGASAPLRFVCTPVEGSRPRSATWELGE